MNHQLDTPACPLSGRLRRKRLWILCASLALAILAGVVCSFLSSGIQVEGRSSANPPSSGEELKAIQGSLEARIEEDLLRTED